ncbi:MAG: CinA family nicotinamide mononucleotide deamidase-related protein [Phycisphaerales bacterium]|jgi:nicotinamide-nucleotide amidase
MTKRPRAAILSVGDELVLGEKLDTNSMWLADQLGRLGLLVTEHRTVPDDLEELSNVMQEMAATADALLVGGGLGPTADDLTREAFAAALGSLTGVPQPLVEDAASIQEIRERFAMAGREMPESNRVQALRPEAARRLPNAFGTAPGMLYQGEASDSARLIACLPGPPREMQPMFESSVAPLLRSLPGIRHAELRVVQVFGLGESEVATRIAGLMQRSNNPAVGTTASSGMVTCRVRVEPSEAVRGPYQTDEPVAAVDEAIAAIEQATGRFVVGYREEPLEAFLLEEATERGVMISTAESCTGGLLSELITGRAGSSEAYAGGWVTYSNAMKQRELGVPGELLQRHGAVSGEVARAMAAGALERSGAGLALSVTGVAGPGGGTSEKPVGTVWIGCATSDQAPIAKRFRFAGGRGSIRRWTANTALFIGLQALRGRLEDRLLRETT